MTALAADVDPSPALVAEGWQLDKLPSGGITYVCETSRCNGPAGLLFVVRPIGDDVLAALRAAGGSDLDTIVRHNLLGLDDAGPKNPWSNVVVTMKTDSGSRIDIIVKGRYGTSDAVIFIRIENGAATAITSIATSPSSAAINLAAGREALQMDRAP